MTGIALTPSPAARRVPLSLRGAQLLLGVPLGVFQLGASIAFVAFVDGVHTGWQALVAAWAWGMSAACAVVALRLARGGARVRSAAAVLLAAQLAFSLVKLAVYHESASLVFGAVVAVAAVLLALSRRRALPL